MHTRERQARARRIRVVQDPSRWVVVGRMGGRDHRGVCRVLWSGYGVPCPGEGRLEAQGSRLEASAACAACLAWN